jgi:hypothetical protein
VTDTANGTAREDGTLLEQLAREVFILRAEVASLRDQLAKEVRTRRLTVVNEDGFESIVVGVGAGAAVVKVIAASDPDTWVSLLAADTSGFISAGVYLSGGGNGAGVFEVNRHGDDSDSDFPGDFDPDTVPTARRST